MKIYKGEHEHWPVRSGQQTSYTDIKKSIHCGRGKGGSMSELGYPRSHIEMFELSCSDGLKTQIQGNP